MTARETLETDLLVVGGGPAGLATAIHFRRRLAELRRTRPELGDFSVTVIEKAREFGAHCLSGAAIEPAALRRLLPDRDLPDFAVPCSEERVEWFTRRSSVKVPWIPRGLRQSGNVVVSLSGLVRWLAEAAEAGGAQLASGFAGVAPIVEQGRVVGVRTGDSGVDRTGKQKASFQAGADIRARVTVLAEGARGSLAPQVDALAGLSTGKPAPVYALGVKDVWRVPERRVAPGFTLHSLGHPLNGSVYGGGFLYGHDGGLVSVGLVVGLDYSDPRTDPYALFQEFKQHPRIRAVLEGGTLVGYGARTLNEGGWYSVPRLYGDGFLLVGEGAGLLDTRRLKGVHLAIESGMLAAETVLSAFVEDDVGAAKLRAYADRVDGSLIRDQLRHSRNFRQAFRWGRALGLAQIGLQELTAGRGLVDPLGPSRGYAEMRRRSGARVPGTPARSATPGEAAVVCDRATALSYSRTSHEENQPVHLVVSDPDLCISRCSREYGNPCERFCPAGVYEIVGPEDGSGKARLVIHAANCLHCKTCEISDPYQIITWVPPEAGGGPVYECL